MFKVGDKVRVIRKATKEEMVGIHWHLDMSDYIGNKYEVSDIIILPKGDFIALKSDKYDNDFYFPSTILDKCRREKIKRLIDEI